MALTSFLDINRVPWAFGYELVGGKLKTIET